MAEQHDPITCRCGTDPLERNGNMPACMCRCDKCKEARERVVYLWERNELVGRLSKAGIDLKHFADLIWIQIEPNLEEKIERMATDALKKALEGAVFRSIIER